ncbi:MAG: hypothetical protein IPK71_00830 [Myxococcales bacterium]|nr:hypothetical protein [Myxococcales bacterium]
MKKFSFVLGLVGLSVLGLACSGGDDPGALPVGAANDPLAARIAELTGAEVLGRADEGAKEAQMYVATTGGSPVLGKLAPSEALAFLGNVGGRVPSAGELATPTEWRSPAVPPRSAFRASSPERTCRSSTRRWCSRGTTTARSRSSGSTRSPTSTAST